MRSTAWNRTYTQLALVFLVLVLLPSFLLGWFSLRAVESERQARQRRLLQDYQRYAEFAGRTLRHELEDLESSWRDLAPVRAGWEMRLPQALAALDSLTRRDRFVRRAWLLEASGALLYPPPTAAEADAAERRAAQRAAPTPAESRLFQELSARGEEAEFDAADAAAAVAAYGEILRRVRSPRLRAIAHAQLGRAEMRRGRWEAALEHYGEILERYPESLDLSNQPLRFLAELQVARAYEEKRDSTSARRMLLALHEDLREHSDEMNEAQYEYFAERLREQLRRLSPAVAVGHGSPALFAGLQPQPKKHVGEAFYVNKLARKLGKAVMDEQPWSPRQRYVSDVADGRPFLLAYVLLPDPSETRVTGLLGFEIDLPRLSAALLPQLLRELDLSRDLHLAVLDENGRSVIGEPAGAGGAPLVQSNLGEPFEFWNVAVLARQPDQIERTVDFRTRVFLYGILLLLLTIVAGAAVVALGLRREARLANLKTSFVSSVSHELRTPLTSIRMYAEMLEMGSTATTDGERRQQLAVIRNECDRLERLIDAVLDFASLQRGSKALHFEFEEIGALVRAAAEQFRGQAESQGFHYEVDVAENLPEVRLDVDAMRQVLFNLLSNAVKYCDRERWIAVRVFARGSEVGIQVEDHGIGIDPAEHERIFQDFYRVDQRLSSGRQGVGLGLTLVRRIVEAHGGRVTVESARGRGARFTVWLPVQRVEAAGDVPRATTEAAGKSGAHPA